MSARKLWFPIVLAVLWVAITAMAMVDFASFDATTRPQRPATVTVEPMALPAS